MYVCMYVFMYVCVCVSLSLSVALCLALSLSILTFYDESIGDLVSEFLPLAEGF